MVGHLVPPRSRASRRAGAALVLVLVVALASAGCTSDKSEGAARAGAQSTAKGLTVEGQWPLTGFTAQGKAPRHPVMVVKMDNTASSSPQIGLSKADLVTEELVEGGLTRLAVFYYQRIPQRVGPVRSMRATDIGILKPARAALVASGGAPQTVGRIKGAGIRAYTEGAAGFERDSGRRAPYNLFMRLRALTAKVKPRTGGPLASYLPFGKATALPQGRPARGLSARFSPGHTTTWSYRAKKYVNENSYAATGDRFRPDNVLVLRVKVGDAGYRDPANNPVPETKFTGSGKAQLFHGGRVYAGTWRKSLDSTIKLKDAAGRPLTVPVGHTWIELVPQKGGTLTVRR